MMNKIKLTSPVGLIAGNGSFPIEFAKNAKQLGHSVVAIAHEGETDQSLMQHVQECFWIKAGQLGKIIDILKRKEVKQVAFAGGLGRQKLFKTLMPDLKALMLMARLRTLNDDTVLRGIASEIEASGVEVFSACEILTDSVPKIGVLTKKGLSNEQMADALIGWECGRIVGKLDVGQTVVVKQKVVVAVEAAEGTDRTIRRAGEVAGNGSVVVKLCKPQQDTRFDLPTIGLETIKTMHEVGCTAVILEAGKSLILHPTEVVKLANSLSISIVAAENEDQLRQFVS